MPFGAFAHQNLSEPLVEVRDLAVALVSKSGPPLPVVVGVSFQVERATIVGLVGESGCGKTTLALALLNLLPPARYRVGGTVRLGDTDLLAAPEAELERIRGAQIAFIFQDPLLALNPVMRVRDQVAEVLRAHRPSGAGNCRAEVEALLRLAGLPAARILDAYPHQLSGGERQRVAIAQALACRPALVIADEPFTALDAGRVVELSALFRSLTGQLGTSFLLISHSPGVLAGIAHRVLVMYAGRIVERGAPEHVFRSPLHPYTAALLRSLPRLDAPGKRLVAIPGNPPGLTGRGPGCAFEPRCGDRLPPCSAAVPGESGGGGRFVRCFRYGA
jgi:peptide/nickel transport system ATP-binding protein